MLAIISIGYVVVDDLSIDSIRARSFVPSYLIYSPFEAVVFIDDVVERSNKSPVESIVDKGVAVLLFIITFPSFLIRVCVEPLF